MSRKVQRTRKGVAMMEVRDGDGHLVEEGHTLRDGRVVLGSRVLSRRVLRDLIAAETALLVSAEDLTERGRREH